MRRLVQPDALTLIKILRHILPGQRAQKHLTDCAAYEVLIRAFKPYLPPLRLSHVFGFSALPDRGVNSQVFVHPVSERIN